jgi:hypothetical protein
MMHLLVWPRKEGDLVNAGEHILVLGLPLWNSGIYKVYLPEVINAETEISELICF